MTLLLNFYIMGVVVGKTVVFEEKTAKGKLGGKTSAHHEVRIFLRKTRRFICTH